MRDRKLLAFTLLAMRHLGDDGARLVEDGGSLLNWHAGPHPLNTQAVRDLLSDGWLRPVPGRSGEVQIDAWPSLVGTELRLHGAEAPS